MLSGLLRQSNWTIRSNTENKLLAGKTGRLDRRTNGRKILYRVGIALGLGLLAHQAWQGVLVLQQTQACVARPSYLGAVFVAYLAAYVVQMAAWALVMHALHAPLSPKAVLEGYALAFLPRYIPGSVWGYLSRNEWLAQSHHVSYVTSTAASLMEAAMLLVTALHLGALFWLPTQWPHPLLRGAILLAGVVTLWAIWRITPWLARRINQQRINQKRTKPELTSPQSGNRAHHSYQAVGLFAIATLLYLLFWALQGLALIAIAHALCGSMALPPFATTAAAALSWAIGFLIIFVPAGLGVREWTLGALLVAFVPFGFATIEPGQATLLAVTSRLGMIVAEVAVLLLGLRAQIAQWWQRRKQVANADSRNHPNQ